MKLLVLGGSGFTGRNMVEKLPRLGDYDIEAPSHQELDVLDERQVFDRLKSGNYDAVVNCLDRHAHEDAFYAEERLRMYHNLANHSDLYGKMTYYGSGAEFGRQEPLENVTENDFARFVPDDSYGFALYQMSLHAMASSNIYDLRLFGIFGDYEAWWRRFISISICKALYGYPLTIRQDRIMDFLDVADLVEMTSWVLQNEPKHHAYNATSGKTYKLSELADMILKTTGVDVPVYIGKEGFAPEYSGNSDLIRGEMGGFVPRTMESSMHELMDFYRERLGEIDREKLLYQ